MANERPMTLLEKAQALPRKRVGRACDRDEAELVVAYANGQISGPQFSTVLGRRRTNATANAWSVLVGALRAGLVTVRMVDDGK